jgi:molecular chaperone DnaJ
MAKDYYKILGVEKNASPEEIKKAFRRLAHEHHPDKVGGNEEKFKEINEAYQVVGNPDKRRQYDQFGADFEQQGGFGGGAGWEDFMRAARGGGGGFQNINFDFGNMGDMFGDIFGFGGNRGRANRGDDVQVDLNLEFKEAIFGVTKNIVLNLLAKCDHCHGNRAEPGTKITDCATCGGAGRVMRNQQTFFGVFQTASVCPTCHGDGKSYERKCSNCRGEGVVRSNQEIELKIPAGVEDQSALKVSGRGQADMNGGLSGDLYVNIRVRPDKNFERRGADIYSSVKINIVEATLGRSVEVLTVDGAVDLEIPAGTQPHTRLRLKGRGVPTARGRGDHFVEVIVEVPERVSRAGKKLLEELREEIK